MADLGLYEEGPNEEIPYPERAKLEGWNYEVCGGDFREYIAKPPPHEQIGVSLSV